MKTYVFYDNELVDVAELSVDKFPQRLLLVPLRLCHSLKNVNKTEEARKWKMIIRDASRICKNVYTEQKNMSRVSTSANPMQQQISCK